MHFRLQHGRHEVPLPRGIFIIGRGEAAQLTLEDPLVSRRHARLTITDAAVTILDLGSQNGVFVNGERIRQTRQLQVGDRVLLGEQELVLLGTADSGRHVRAARHDTAPPPSHVTPRSLPRPAPVREPRPSHPDAAPPGREPRVPSPPPARALDPEESTQSRSLLEILDDMTTRALADGRTEEAERLLDAHLRRLLDSAGSASGEVLRDASLLALRVAEATESARWFDYVVDLHRQIGRPPAQSVLASMDPLAKRLRGVDPERLRDLVRGLEHRASTLSQEDRLALVKLIELAGALAAKGARVRG